MYAILRTKRIKTTDKFTQMCRHNLRDRTENEVNINSKKSHLNEILIDEFDLQSSKEFGGGYSKKLTEYYDKLGIKQRKDAVQAVEIIVSASPEFFKKASDKEKSDWVKHQVDFAKKEYGKNLKLAVLHEDESTTHIHFVISTEITKVQKFKNRYGECEKLVTSLNAKRFNKSYLIDLHTRYAKHNEKFGLIRGAFNSEADHQDLEEFRRDIKKSTEVDYTKVINEEIDKKFSGSTFGIEHRFTAEEIKKGLTPFINKLAKAQKKLKTKAENTTPAVVQSHNEVVQLKEWLEEKKNDYTDAINTNTALRAELVEVKEELKRWKPEENTQKPEVQEVPTAHLGITRPKIR